MCAVRSHQQRAVFSVMIAGFTVAVACAHTPATPADQLTRGHPHGIWKAAVPPRPMNGEFDDFDPLGIIAGARIKADCSLNWRSPDDGRLYCFSSGTSLEVFLEDPQVSLARAARAWRAMAARRPSAQRARAAAPIR